MKVTILGSGSAYGVPYVGNNWGDCDPSNPKNRRTSASVLLENGDSKLLIDMGADFKAQSERHNVRKVDGLFLTHPHADHIAGMMHLPVMMSYFQDRGLPLYADRFTRKEVEKVWWFMFDPAINVEYFGPGRPYWSEIIPYFEQKMGDFTVMPFVQNHGRINTMGLRVGDFAYSTDVREFPQESFDLLKGVKTWVVECDNELDKHGSHSFLEQTLAWIEIVKPEKAYLTHLNFTMDYDKISAKLPPNVELAYDGLMFEVDHTAAMPKAVLPKKTHMTNAAPPLPRFTP